MRSCGAGPRQLIQGSRRCCRVVISGAVGSKLPRTELRGPMTSRLARDKGGFFELTWRPRDGL